VHPQTATPFAQDVEVTLSLKVVLAVGVDSWLLAAHSAAWRPAGIIVLSAVTMREAFDHFRAGDFDLVLLGHSLPVESKERLTLLIRSSGDRTPVVSIANSSGDCDWFADATIRNDSEALLQGMGELLAEGSRLRSRQTVLAGIAC
jgi:CheY-like chemotaxis protein